MALLAVMWEEYKQKNTGLIIVALLALFNLYIVLNN